MLQSHTEDINPLFEADGDPLDFDSMREVLKHRVPGVDDDNLHRITGLMVAATGGGKRRRTHNRG